MNKNNLRSKVTKFYANHKAACLIVTGIISGAVGIAVGKKMEHDHTQEMQEMYDIESRIYNAATDMELFYNDYDKPMGTVRDLPEGDYMTEAIREESNVTDDTEIIGIKYYFKNN
jgi:hypothetical protein|nr:MAG TPA: hypothetical protein [Caudoviricetes sp.]